MKAIVVSSAAADNPTPNYTADQSTHKIKTVVLCGACGAQELSVGDNKTECPYCDEYIY